MSDFDVFAALNTSLGASQSKLMDARMPARGTRGATRGNAKKREVRKSSSRSSGSPKRERKVRARGHAPVGRGGRSERRSAPTGRDKALPGGRGRRSERRSVPTGLDKASPEGRGKIQADGSGSVTSLASNISGGGAAGRGARGSSRANTKQEDSQKLAIRFGEILNELRSIMREHGKESNEYKDKQRELSRVDKQLKNRPVHELNAESRAYQTTIKIEEIKKDLLADLKVLASKRDGGEDYTQKQHEISQIDARLAKRSSQFHFQATANSRDREKDDVELVKRYAAKRKREVQEATDRKEAGEKKRKKQKVEATSPAPKAKDEWKSCGSPAWQLNRNCR